MFHRRLGSVSRLSCLSVAFLVSATFFAPSRASGADEIKVRHILVRKRSEADTALDYLVNEGVNRKNFIVAARKFSMDPVTKGAGGDLGWNTRGKFVPEFSAEAFDLQPGEVSEPVKTEFGWHLIFVEERRETRRGKPPTPPVSVFNPPTTPGQTGDLTTGQSAPAATQPAATQPAATQPAATQPAATPKTTTPTTTADRVKPTVVMKPKFLRVAFEVKRTRVRPTQGIEVDISLINEGTQDLTIFHPDLLALGLSVRSDFPPTQPPMDRSPVSDPPTFLSELKSRSSVGRLIVLTDYFPDIPANNRIWVKWDSKTLLDNFEKRFPGQAAKITEFAKAKAAISGSYSEYAQEVRGFYHTLNRPRGQPRNFNEVPVAVFEGFRGGQQDQKFFARLDLTGDPTSLWVQLYTDKQYQGAIWFSQLALQGFYDGLDFFDVKPGEYLRGGCPRGDGTSGPQMAYTSVKNSADITHAKGTLSLVTRYDAKRRGTVAGSVFFVTLKDQPSWDKSHVPIGKIVQGQEALERLANRPNTRSIRIKTVTIVPIDRAPPSIAGELATAKSSTSQTEPAQATQTTSSTPTPTPAATQENKVEILTRAGALPRVHLETSKGPLTVELYQDDARNTVNNFVSLVESGFFKNDMKVLQKAGDYFLRTGSPDNSPTGSPDYRIRNEVENNTRAHEKGTLSMCLETGSDRQPIADTAGSQFMICLKDIPYYNGLYTPFGKVTKGVEVLDQLGEGDSITAITIEAKRAGQYRPVTVPR